MAKLKKLTQEQKAEVKLLSAYLNLEQIADHLGICKKTFYSMRQRDPEVDACYRKGRSNAIATTVKYLFENIRKGKEASIIFFLKTQAGWSENKDLNNEDNDDALERLLSAQDEALNK